MENVIYANSFEDHVEGLTICPSKTSSNGETNPEFILWRMILSWIYCRNYGTNNRVSNLP